MQRFFVTSYKQYAFSDQTVLRTFLRGTAHWGAPRELQGLFSACIRTANRNAVVMSALHAHISSLEIDSFATFQKLS